ncbi:MAG: TolC family protein [Bacteriovoracaceae bacterium]|nr:TolC family protein [Bacteriovoracaceae bacterium]
MLHVATLLLLLSLSVDAQDSFSLTEKNLTQLSLETSPQWESIEAAFLSAKSDAEQLNDGFRPEIFGEAQYGETKEKPIIEFIPMWSPLKSTQLGIRQDFRGGVTMSAAVSATQQSATTPTATYKNISTSTVRLDLQVDLWKDLFGRLSKAKTNSANFSKERAEFEKDIQHKAFVVSLRRTYWSLVGNNEQIKVSEGLLKAAEQQLTDTRQRRRAGVADDGEVARYEAQVASRKGNIIYYKYQREILLKQLKFLLPELQTKNVVLAEYDLSSTIDQVLACTQTIATRPEVPYEYTKYDEITQLIRQTQKEQAKLASSYDDIDLKLVGTAKTTGVASVANGTVNTGSYGDAFDDWQENDRTGYSVALQLVIPLGKTDTRQTQEVLAQKRFDAQVNETEANIASTHQQLVRSIQLLAEMVQNQKLNTIALEKRLAVQNRKFREARVSVNDLIQDQDSLLSSNLSVINTQLQILNTLFDYLVVFTETPCEFNRI